MVTNKYFPKLQPKLQSCSSSVQEIHLGHLAGLDAVYDVDVGLHRLVVGVAGPFHHDVGRDASGSGQEARIRSRHRAGIRRTKSGV